MRSLQILLVLFWFLVGVSHAREACGPTTIEFAGLHRVDHDWLQDYLRLADGKELDEIDDDTLLQIRRKLLTTDIFSDVHVDLAKHENGRCVITINVKEKWTRIPVIRGAYGGGTPLMILGGYETNAFGKMIAIGAEVRRYGSMAPGAFFFLKSPRAWRGRGLWGGELWLDRRRRAFYDSDAKNYGFVDSEAWTMKAQWLYPVGVSPKSHWQMGFQAQAFRESRPIFKAIDHYGGSNKGAPHDLTLGEKSGFGGLFAPMIAFDNLSVEGLNSQGLKFKFSIGGSRNAGSSGGFSEMEAFGFYAVNSDFNLATHLYGATTSQNSVGAVYYLGGFDSVRGLPDGIRYGNRIVYGNFEARAIAGRFQFAHIQPAVFFDTGSAWMNDHDPSRGQEASLGGGVRIAIPQIYRFILRFDYGTSIGHSRSHGFSVGLNQFFQPYKMVF